MTRKCIARQLPCLTFGSFKTLSAQVSSLHRTTNATATCYIFVFLCDGSWAVLVFNNYCLVLCNVSNCVCCFCWFYMHACSISLFILSSHFRRVQLCHVCFTTFVCASFYFGHAIICIATYSRVCVCSASLRSGAVCRDPFSFMAILTSLEGILSVWAWRLQRI